MVDYNMQFLEACKSGRIEQAKQLVTEHQVDVHGNDEDAFKWACRNGYIEIAKWLVQDHQVDVHIDYEKAFRWAQNNGQIKITNWLIEDHQVDEHATDKMLFKIACQAENIPVIKMCVEKYRNSGKPYCYRNKTGYILNHEPINDWQSCTILGCPIIYIGELDEPALIAHMATLKKLKSVCS